MKAINLDDAVRTLTMAVDLVGISEIHHGKRVAVMALQLADLLGWSLGEKLFLYQAAMLHDCGVSRSDEHMELVTRFEWDRAQEHCLRGSRYLADVGPLSALAPVLLWHHTHIENIPKSVPERIARHANLVFIADRIDALRAQHDIVNHPEHIADITSMIASQSGTAFRPDFVDAARQAMSSEAFWFDIEDNVIEQVLDALVLPWERRELEWHEIHEISRLFARIIDAKSPFTANHSLGVAMLARRLAELEGRPEENCREIELAGLLHDIGKLRVPDEVLEKPGPLDLGERRVMVRHAYETLMLLQRLFGTHPIANWAAWHHETPAGNGYPFHIKADGFPAEARIIAVADIFQALLQDRPYRDGLSPKDALTIMEDLANRNVLDSSVLGILKGNLSLCAAVATGRNVHDERGLAMQSVC